mmetsp:Transcript_508/g.1314  ORF Transcript_508/g.1314 Transcript_508/m.1314 type:complete len:268 (-) Transcript_508:69-872(-)
MLSASSVVAASDRAAASISSIMRSRLSMSGDTSSGSHTVSTARMQRQLRMTSSVAASHEADSRQSSAIAMHSPPRAPMRAQTPSAAAFLSCAAAQVPDLKEELEVLASGTALMCTLGSKLPHTTERMSVMTTRAPSAASARPVTPVPDPSSRTLCCFSLRSHRSAGLTICARNCRNMSPSDPLVPPPRSIERSACGSICIAITGAPSLGIALLCKQLSLVLFLRVHCLPLPTNLRASSAFMTASRPSSARSTQDASHMEKPVEPASV